MLLLGRIDTHIHPGDVHSLELRERREGEWWASISYMSTCRRRDRDRAGEGEREESVQCCGQNGQQDMPYRRHMVCFFTLFPLSSLSLSLLSLFLLQCCTTIEP